MYFELNGPKGTPYENGKFLIKYEIDLKRFPYAPPTITFLT